jgi:Uma2 family endonuclease
MDITSADAFHSSHVPLPPQCEEDDPFRYGRRYVKRVLPNGREVLDVVPLTLEDVLHPQEGDEISERPRQRKDSEYLAPILRQRIQRVPGGHLTDDCLVEWRPGLPRHAPDFAAFEGLTKEPSDDVGVFQVAEYGAKCLFALEIVSPLTRTNDVDAKLEEYHEARVPLYLLIDQEVEGGPRRLLAYRWKSDGYQLVKLDSQGRVALKKLGLLLGVRDDRAVAYDAETGEELAGYGQLEDRNAQLQEAYEEARQRIRDLEQKLKKLGDR